MHLLIGHRREGSQVGRGTSGKDRKGKGGGGYMKTADQTGVGGEKVCSATWSRSFSIFLNRATKEKRKEKTKDISSNNKKIEEF